MKIMTIVGARPQFIKAAAISRRLQDSNYAGVKEEIVHTGQHYDPNLSEAFFQELEIPAPAYHLGLGQMEDKDMQLGAMISALRKIFEQSKPDCVLVYGDTNSTLAGALAAAHTGRKLAHVEAGLRSYRSAMPEEINRVLTDRLSDLLFCPTQNAVENLAKEGKENNVWLCGDVMFDVFKREMQFADSQVFTELNLQNDGFLFATIHRAENTDDEERLLCICKSLSAVAEKVPVVLPLHPRTASKIENLSIKALNGVTVIPPISYRQVLALLDRCSLVVTDSGGLQKEAYFAEVPCITLRDETEWVETLNMGWNTLCAPASGEEAIHRMSQCIISGLDKGERPKPVPVFGDGDASRLVLDGIVASA